MEIIENIFLLYGNMIFPSIMENQENMIFTLSVFMKMLFFMQWIGSTLVDLSEIWFGGSFDASFETISKGSLELCFYWLLS